MEGPGRPLKKSQKNESSGDSAINSVQTRCIVKGEAHARKVHFSGDFLGAFAFLRIACSLGIPQEENLEI